MPPVNHPTRRMRANDQAADPINDPCDECGCTWAPQLHSETRLAGIVASIVLWLLALMFLGCAGAEFPRSGWTPLAIIGAALWQIFWLPAMISKVPVWYCPGCGRRV